MFFTTLTDLQAFLLATSATGIARFQVMRRISIHPVDVALDGLSRFTFALEGNEWRLHLHGRGFPYAGVTSFQNGKFVVEDKRLDSTQYTIALYTTLDLLEPPPLARRVLQYLVETDESVYAFQMAKLLYGDGWARRSTSHGAWVVAVDRAFRTLNRMGLVTMFGDKYRQVVLSREGKWYLGLQQEKLHSE